MSWRARYTILIVIVLLPVALFSGFCGAHILEKNRLQSGYDSIRVGDTRQKVFESMGSPAEIEPCFQKSDCTSIYYGVTFQRWIVCLDSNDKVIDRIHNEGLF
jgi:hypothetical protein